MGDVSGWMRCPVLGVSTWGVSSPKGFVGIARRFQRRADTVGGCGGQAAFVKRGILQVGSSVLRNFAG
jgi:hypothetical protein